VAVAGKRGMKTGGNSIRLATWSLRWTRCRIRLGSSLFKPCLRLRSPTSTCSYSLDQPFLLSRKWLSHMESHEFLGDALLEFYVIDKLYRSLPEGLAGSLSQAVSTPALSYIAIKQLGTHSHLLHLTSLLPSAPAEDAEEAKTVLWPKVAQGLGTWMFGPPKVLGDVFEALVGAV